VTGSFDANFPAYDFVYHPGVLAEAYGTERTFANTIQQYTALNNGI
jgi:hypothetical protein